MPAGYSRARRLEVLMRLAYLFAPVLGLVLVGCGQDDAAREVVTPEPAIEKPEPPFTGAPPSNDGAGAGPEAGAPLATGAEGSMDTAPADNGSGLGTASGAGTAPHTTPGASGAAQ
ncbi:hypothetical protein [Stutzerimonas xanthomarina]|uniref:hypothetical protein n=1 Tax=Stutzerimonas xanthomarina TaxID=271420 RepID=UPI002D808A4E|nr:hypothetical protein [Stutzerimonas xanthomarina]